MSILPLRKPIVAAPPSDVQPRTAIIDIGSNSIRLVVYQGHARLPAILFNEKVLAGLGRSLAVSGSIDSQAMAAAHVALARFAAVARAMEVTNLRTVATAAVRDAKNGGELIAAAQALGLTVEMLSGKQEARAAGEGVLSAIPQADGIVGDLGGGSLELVRVRAGKVEDRVSFPLGVLRIAGARAKRGKVLERLVARMVREAGWTGKGKGLPLYLVGGSWRALARLDMTLSGYPLPVIHQYVMTPTTIAQLGRRVAHLSKARLKSVAGLSSGRAGTLGDATALLGVLLRQIGSSTTITSAFGLREGLLYGALDEETKRLDPLIVAAREEGRIIGRFPEHGDLLDAWIAPLFAGQPLAVARLRHTACLLADVGWRANPEFRAERGVEVALHGNWVAIEASGRAMLAQALYTSLDGGMTAPDPVGQLASAAELRMASAWGLAMRLGQRLSGGLAGPLQCSRLTLENGILTLALKDRALYGEAVEKRHQALAALWQVKAVVRDL
ncbi:Ppx/GppA family phosphatase [Sphingomonas sp. CROZ-RG-20F-R02-07]|uniref:Ppx/GppA family phosphatase n=1 Tax=Sphingomonas sp. CROZ-RG-20F-R02-07 TaxID=2914832 RepID=UPI001F5A90CC|nr:Ppx/GppA family phosphatase [Sphingomonas sp. CROZ-RG-20F-R02-07]